MTPMFSGGAISSGAGVSRTSTQVVADLVMGSTGMVRRYFSSTRVWREAGYLPLSWIILVDELPELEEVFLEDGFPGPLGRALVLGEAQADQDADEGEDDDHLDEGESGPLRCFVVSCRPHQSLYRVPSRALARLFV